MKRKPAKTVQDFSTRFLKIYNVIPNHVKPPTGAAQLQYVEAFDGDFAYSLREIRSASLTYTMNDAIEVEVNMMALGKMNNKDVDKRKNKEEILSPSSSDSKFENIMRTMERLVNRLSLENKQVHVQQQDAQIRNPNSRRPLIPQPRQRDQRNHNDQQIRPPFQENMLDDEYLPEKENHIHYIDQSQTNCYLTKEEHDHAKENHEVSHVIAEEEQGGKIWQPWFANRKVILLRLKKD
jgi:hypothetical protein